MSHNNYHLQKVLGRADEAASTLVMSLSFSDKKNKQISRRSWRFSGLYFYKPVTHGSKGMLEKT